jgi:hypothetical protein
MINFCVINFKYIYHQHAGVRIYLNATHSNLKQALSIEDAIFDNLYHEHQPYCQKEHIYHTIEPR